MEKENLDNDYFSSFLKIGNDDFNENRRFAIISPCKNTRDNVNRPPLRYDLTTGNKIDNNGVVSSGFALPLLWNNTIYISNEVSESILTPDYCNKVKSDYKLLLDKIIETENKNYELQKIKDHRNFLLENYNSILVKPIKESLTIDSNKILNFRTFIDSDYSYVEIVGIYGGDPETSFIVDDISLDLAKSLSLEYFQDGFIYFDSSKKDSEFEYYCYSLKDNEYKLTDTQPRVNFKPIEFKNTNPELYNQYKDANYENVKDKDNTYASFIEPKNGNGCFSINFKDTAYYCEKVIEIVDKNKIKTEYNQYRYYVVYILSIIMNLLDDYILKYGKNYKLSTEISNLYPTLNDLVRNFYNLIDNFYNYHSPVKVVDSLKNDYDYYCYVIYRNNNEKFDLKDPNIVLVLDKEFVDYLGKMNFSSNKTDAIVDDNSKSILSNAIFGDLIN